jgi:hypothetical protein
MECVCIFAASSNEGDTKTTTMNILAKELKAGDVVRYGYHGSITVEGVSERTQKNGKKVTIVSGTRYAQKVKVSGFVRNWETHKMEVEFKSETTVQVK